MRLPPSIANRMVLPLIAAPMFLVSGPELVAETCRAGIIGAFPTANARTAHDLDAWLTQLRAEIGRHHAPFCPNLIMRRDDLDDHVRLLIRHEAEMVITSVGSPAPVVDRLHDAGCLVFADVATVRQAHKAIAAGADGLVLLSAGAGGQTGRLNGMAFVRAVRGFYDGPIALAGGISDGVALFAARILGCDLGYMGTRFIATNESRAPQAYKDMIVASSADDVTLTTAVTGLETNMLRASLAASKAQIDATDTIAPRPAYLGSGADVAKPWKDVWSAGHTVSGARVQRSVSDLVAELAAEYRGAEAGAAKRGSW